MASDDRRNVRHRFVELGGLRLFYREVGDADAPAVLALHGFPASSHQYRSLLPALGDTHRVLAPDLPGFGRSACPPHTAFTYSFDRLAETIEAFLHALGLQRTALVLHDYGAQVGFRVAMRGPARITALVVLNSEAWYEDGRNSEAWAAMEAYWDDPTPARRDAIRARLFTPDGIRSEFTEKLPPSLVERIDPATIDLAWAEMQRPAAIEAMLDLHRDYARNVAMQPRLHAYFREQQPPTLVLWGREDQYYGPAAAAAYRRALPAAEIHLLDGGHWIVETHAAQVNALTCAFLRQR